MSTVFDNDILIHHIAAPGLPGDGFTAPEAAAIRDDLDTLLSRPVITSLGDIPDVDVATAADGQVLIYDAGAGEWVPAPMVSGVSRIARRGLTIHPEARALDFWTGFTVTQLTEDFTDYARVDLNFGGTGTSELPARVDHTHTQPLPVRVTTAPSGYISGSSQPLGSTSVILPNGIACVVEAELYGQFRGADTGAAYYTLSITIGSGTGATFTSPGGTGGFWCVQGVPDKINWEHERKLTGTGSAVPVSASVAWHSGSGFNIDRTYLKVRVRPDR